MAELLKNYYNQELMDKLAGFISVYHQPFNQSKFISSISKRTRQG